MKILVTGGAGFIGSHLIRRLRKENCEVVVLDNLSTGKRENLPRDVRLHVADIRDESLTAFVEREHFDAAVHLAGQTMVNESILNPKLDAAVNVTGTINLLEAVKVGGVRRIIFASTAAVYGDVAADDLPIRETQTLNPQSFYALTKMTAENYLRLYRELFGVDYVILRFANVYGEYQSERGEGGVIGIFSKLAAQRKCPTIFGDGLQTRDFIHAEDIADGIFSALRTTATNDVYNLSTQSEVSLLSLIKLLSETAGCEISANRQPPRAGDIKRSSLSNEKAAAKLDWRPKISLREGLRRTYKFFSEHPPRDR